MTPPTPRGRQPLPTSANAMLATLTEDRFSDPNWLFEPKWDGERCLAFRTKAGQVRLRSRNDKPLEGTFPEIADAVSRHCQVAAVLDGEVVAFTGRRTSFERLQGRMGLTDPVPAQATGIAVVYCVFDVLYLDGDDLRSRPLRERKRLLRDAVNFTAPLRFTPHRNTTGEDEYRKACARGDEGVIAKRADSPYTGGRSKDWLKFKCVRDQELVVGGYTAPKGSRTGFGALLVGYYDGADFVYAGKVGTGFNAEVLASLHARMQALERPTSPFDRGRIRESAVHWVQPQIVAQIGFSEWTRDGLLRHPRYTGLRDDKAARDVVRESR
jgi:bifunctional non-homologous end joining protein LigD